MNRKSARVTSLEFAPAEVIEGLKLLYPEDIHVQAIPKISAECSKFGGYLESARLRTLHVEWIRESDVATGTPGKRGAIVRVTDAEV